MHRALLLIAIAVGEGGTGLLLLLSPSVPLALDQVSPEASFLARITGAALVALGIGCWLARSDLHSPAQSGMLTGVLIFDVAAAALLSYAGLFLNLVGIALWPAVLVHAALAMWCLVSLRDKPHDGNVGTRADLKALRRDKEANG